MASWLPLFVIIIALAFALQVAVLAALYIQLRQMNERTTRIATDLQAKLSPILLRLQMILEDAQPRISGMLADTAEITYLARNQAQKVDRIFTEAADRLRAQLIRADRILAGTLEALEEVGSKARRTFWEPVQQASAFIKGVKTGLEFFRSQRRPERSNEPQQDEGLFI